jgi:hypothetical protein
VTWDAVTPFLLVAGILAAGWLVCRVTARVSVWLGVGLVAIVLGCAIHRATRPTRNGEDVMGQSFELLLLWCPAVLSVAIGAGLGVVLRRKRRTQR